MKPMIGFVARRDGGVRPLSPLCDAATANGGVRSERFYYDGARRVQELVTDPMATIELVQGSNSQGQNLELGELMVQTVPPPVLANGDGSATPLSFESAQLNNPGETIGSGGTPLPESLSGLEREYIWGPGDNGLDELLVQFDINRAPWWMIQDAGGDIVAMCDLNGSGGTARIVHTWQYDAYGQCLRADQLVTDTSTYKIPQNRCGHKGLFMDRLDVGIANPTTYADNPRLAPFSTVLYQNRNRTYSPQLGRFIQRDPNESGQLLAAMQAHSATIPVGSGGTFEMDGLYTDGGSLHGYLRGSPLIGRDPFGLLDDFSLGGLAAKMGIGAAVGAVLGGSLSGISAYANGESADEIARQAGWGALAGGVGGAMLGGGLLGASWVSSSFLGLSGSGAVIFGAGAGATVGAVSAFTESMISQQLIQGKIDWNEAAFAAGAGALTGGFAHGWASKGIGATNLNSVEHLFGAKNLSKHKLAGFLSKFLTPQNAYRALERAAQKEVSRGGLSGLFSVVVNVAGEKITVEGKVIDGVVRIGTAFK